MLAMSDNQIVSLKCVDWENCGHPPFLQTQVPFKKLLHSPKLGLPLLAIDHKAWLIN